MSPRAAGSGLHMDAALGVEQLWADLLAGRSPAAAMRVLHRARANGRCGVAPATIRRWLTVTATRTLPHLSSPVLGAHRISPFDHADVVAFLGHGGEALFELKSQLTKNFNDVAQSDWVRDETDALVWLRTHNAAYRRHLGPVFASWLRRPAGYLGTWSLEDLVLADIAGVRTTSKRAALGIQNRSDLDAYIDRKYFLHTTQQGSRVCRLGDLEPVRAIRGGATLGYTLRANRTGVGLWILAPPTAAPWFSYNLYTGAAGPYGRHKLHARSLNGVTWI